LIEVALIEAATDEVTEGVDRTGWGCPKEGRRAGGRDPYGAGIGPETRERGCARPGGSMPFITGIEMGPPPVDEGMMIQGPTMFPKALLRGGSAGGRVMVMLAESDWIELMSSRGFIFRGFS